MLAVIIWISEFLFKVLDIGSKPAVNLIYIVNKVFFKVVSFEWLSIMP